MNSFAFAKKIASSFSGKIHLTLKKFLLLLDQTNLCFSHKDATHKSIRELNDSINSLKSKQYIVKSILYGHPYTLIKRIQSYVFRRLLWRDIRVTYVPFFGKAVNRLVNRQSSDKVLSINDPVFILPYYVTHYGHYTGELLGLLMLYANLIKNNCHNINRKLVYVEGDDDCELMISVCGITDYCLKITPELALDHSLKFTDAIVLPLVHPWQNISYLRNILSTNFPYESTKSDKVFLTSNRFERIRNLDELIQFLTAKKFEILDASTCDSVTASKIRNAKVLICEDATISHMPLIHRNHKYFVLRSELIKYNYSDVHYSSGFIFTEFHEGLRIHVPCRLAKEQKHPLSAQLHVNIPELQQLLSEHYPYLQ